MTLHSGASLFFVHQPGTITIPPLENIEPTTSNDHAPSPPNNFLSGESSEDENDSEEENDEVIDENIIINAKDWKLAI